MLIALCEEDTDSEDSANAVSQQGRFDEIVVFGDENFTKCFWRCDHYSFCI